MLKNVVWSTFSLKSWLPGWIADQVTVCGTIGEVPPTLNPYPTLKNEFSRFTTSVPLSRSVLELGVAGMGGDGRLSSALPMPRSSTACPVAKVVPFSTTLPVATCQSGGLATTCANGVGISFW